MLTRSGGVRSASALFAMAAIAACGGRTGLDADGFGAGGLGGASSTGVVSSSASVASSSSGLAMTCAPGEVATCYTGPPGTSGVAACKDGTWVCASDGLGFGPCTGQVLPSFEDCGTAADEDCDGATPACAASFTHIAPGELYPVGTAVDFAGGLILAGVLAGTADLGGGVVLSTPDSTDLALLRYDGSGNLDWAKQLRSDAVKASALGSVAESGGFIFVAASVHGAVDLGQGPIPGDGGVVAKLDASGGLVWAVRTSDSVLKLAVDTSGNVYAVGSCESHWQWDCTDRSHLMKLSPSGQLLWDRDFGPDVPFYAFGIGVSSQGEVVFGGSFVGTLDVGTGPLAGPDDPGGAFLIKLDPQGNTLWARSFFDEVKEGEDLMFFPLVHGAPFGSGTIQGQASAGIYALAIAPNDDVLVAGKMNDTIDLGGGPLTSPHQGLFLARFDANGDHVWSRTVGAPLDDTPPDIAVAPSGDVLIAAYAYPSNNAPPGALGFDFGGGLLPKGLALARLDAAGQHVASTSYFAKKPYAWMSIHGTPDAVWAAGNGADIVIGMDSGPGLYVAKLQGP